MVISRNSSFTYKGKAINVKQVGRDLGVRYVLEVVCVTQATESGSLSSSSILRPAGTL
jgi:TolB-like protein